MLRLESVTAQAGSFTLRPLELQIAAGECHALLGPSGAGKSTVLELIVGFRRLESGRILMNGRNITHVPVEQRGIGYLPQQLALFPHLTVKENILYGIRSRRNPNPADLAFMDSLTHALGIAHLKERRPASLSGGERQRVALARALAPAPELLILDEPFSSLNETLRRELWHLLKGLQRDYRVATLMVTHDLEEAFFLGKQVHILIDGSLHQSGERKVVFHRPTTLEAARFLGIQNLFPVRVIRKDSRAAVLDCGSLATQFTIDNGTFETLNFICGDSLTVGIHPEFVVLNRNDQTGSPGDPRLKGTVVGISETVHGSVISFKPNGAETLVTMNIGVRETTSLEQNEFEISLPLRHLFFVPAGKVRAQS